PAEFNAAATTVSASPRNPQFFTTTNVRPGPIDSNVHSTRVGLSGPFHSMRIRSFASSAFTSTFVDAPYISQSQRTFAADVSRPLLFENQKRVVFAGSTSASNTSAAGLRM